ncbi:AGE family epimerase/isomerase [Reinekea marinisedimentorum]|uniref:Mannobiose 2-epimerase n=1 Tax=Reinekea marinisedimentorum TaxID=230495 RepID=A0A4R3IEB6_9GAMM|nr:AGE family epimerase/isomerase [Reinekea marinisedimentorum]TCS43938.1 mannobiose 2-epimerase [Reinekea marinisedimentorum]
MPATHTHLMAEIAVKAENQVTKQILPFWDRAVIHPEGGLYGAVAVTGEADTAAEQGILLYARTLWSYATAAINLQSDSCLATAHRLYQALTHYFMDAQNGGVYWTIDASHQPVDTDKYLLAHSYSLFALAKYVEASGNQAALQAAFELEGLIQQHFLREDGTYCGHLGADFQPAPDSDEENLTATCNQLHTLEALTQLYSASPTASVKQRIEAILDIFTVKIVRHQGHLPLLFNRQWQPLPAETSIGHNLEAPWLCCLACMVIDDEARLAQFQPHLLRLIDVSLSRGVHSSGNILFGLDENGQAPDVLFWWPQTEALCALYCAAELTGETGYTEQLAKLWQNIENHWVDAEHGEWYSQLNLNLEPVLSEGKAGPWRSIYHIVRACSLLSGGFAAVANVNNKNQRHQRNSNDD